MPGGDVSRRPSSEQPGDLPRFASFKTVVVFGALAASNFAISAEAGWIIGLDLKTGKATMAGRIEGLFGKLGDMAWMD
jgi:hypothetical protein